MFYNRASFGARLDRWRVVLWPPGLRGGVAPYFLGWQLANESLIGAIKDLTPEQLGLPVGSPSWPIWASVSHVAGARLFWLCHVFGEPGQDSTPFRGLDLTSGGWGDDPAHPRGADELVEALALSWDIIARCLATWTPESLGQTAPRTSRRFGPGPYAAVRAVASDHARRLSQRRSVAGTRQPRARRNRDVVGTIAACALTPV
jgi:hypothetical protein